MSYKGISQLIPPTRINAEWKDDPVKNPSSCRSFSLSSKAYKNGVKAPRSMAWVVTAIKEFNILATSKNIVLIIDAKSEIEAINSFSIALT